jgi:hypothetical protein
MASDASFKSQFCGNNYIDMYYSSSDNSDNDIYCESCIPDCDALYFGQSQFESFRIKNREVNDSYKIKDFYCYLKDDSSAFNDHIGYIIYE